MTECPVAAACLHLIAVSPFPGATILVSAPIGSLPEVIQLFQVFLSYNLILFFFSFILLSPHLLVKKEMEQLSACLR